MTERDRDSERERERGREIDVGRELHRSYVITRQRIVLNCVLLIMFYDLLLPKVIFSSNFLFLLLFFSCGHATL